MAYLLRKNARIILATLLLGFLLWLLFAPVQLGGAVSYVIVNGSSMEPDHSLGDLVVTRARAEYQINQKVVYSHPQVGFVFHRIVELDGDQFVLQGDNNDWLDSYQPAEEEILGRYWFSVPGGGKVIRTLREPIYFTLFSLIILAIIASILFLNRSQSGKRASRRDIMDNKPPNPRGEIRQEILLMLAVLALAALIAGAVAFSRPLTRVASEMVFYKHGGQLSYTSTEKDIIYDTATVRTGDPIYFLLACDVVLDFSYTFTASELAPLEAASLQGSYLIDARLSDADGWTRSFQLVPQTEFSGQSFQSQTELDVCQIHDLILAKEEKTGAESRLYDFVVLPQIEITGKLKGVLLDDTYQPQITFQFTPTLMRLPEAETALMLDQEGFVTDEYVTTNTLTVFGSSVSIYRARQAAVLVFGVSLLAAVYPGYTLIRDIRRSEQSRIQVQYHPLLVDVSDGDPASQASQVVEVSSFADLSKMAERYGAMILHEVRGSFHRYSVQDEQIVYQYAVNISSGESLFPQRRGFRRDLLAAIDQDQLELYYQPVVKLEDRSVIGLEAFIRWNHPEFGELYPADFISHAEDLGLVPRLDSWVVHHVCQQIRGWRESGVPVVPVSINISPETIGESGFLEEIRTIVLENLCDPSLIQLEINRSNQVFRDRIISSRLEELTELGLQLAIDNFATDAANQINKIFEMPLKTIKIDRTVVQGIRGDQDARRVLNGVAQLAHSLDVEVVAQGVESSQDIQLLEEEGIKLAQGFHLGAPLQAADLVSLLEGKPLAAREKKEK